MLRSAPLVTLVLASQACSSSDPALEPIRIIRGDPSQGTWFDVTIMGFALDEHNGRLATSLYKRKVLLIDIDGDGLCNAKTDLVFVNSSFTAKPLDLAATVDSSIELPPSMRLMARSFEDSDCEPFLSPWPTE
jgi:hypothetical protein